MAMIEEVAGTCSRRYCKFIYSGARKTCPAIGGKVILKWVLEQVKAWIEFW